MAASAPLHLLQAAEREQTDSIVISDEDETEDEEDGEEDADVQLLSCAHGQAARGEKPTRGAATQHTQAPKLARQASGADVVFLERTTMPKRAKLTAVQKWSAVKRAPGPRGYLKLKQHRLKGEARGATADEATAEGSWASGTRPRRLEADVVVMTSPPQPTPAPAKAAGADSALAQRQQRLQQRRAYEDLARAHQHALAAYALDMPDIVALPSKGDENLGECIVCYDDLTPSSVFRVPICGHAFCQTCATQHARLCLEENSGGAVTCPALQEDGAGCTKEIEIAQLTSLFALAQLPNAKELLERYSQRLFERTLEKEGEYIPCPRILDMEGVSTAAAGAGAAAVAATAITPGAVAAATAAMADTAASANEAGASATKRACGGYAVRRNKKKAECLSCRFVFCPTCKLPAHKDSCDEARKQAACAANADQNEAAYLAWREEAGTKACPSCGQDVERVSGCNRVTCRCGAVFCYVCGWRGKNIEEVYSHLRAQHNGYYPPGHQQAQPAQAQGQAQGRDQAQAQALARARVQALEAAVAPLPRYMGDLDALARRFLMQGMGLF